jgi:hypothetical protein
MVYFSSAPRFSSACGSFTASPPRTCSMAFSMAAFEAPASLSSLASVCLSSNEASTNSSLEM